MLHPRLDPPAPGPLEELLEFRSAFYRCATRWPDALFELTDANIAGHAVTGLPPPHLSLEPIFRRGHGSSYAALSKGRLDADQLRDCLIQFRPRTWPLVFAVDTSSWPRCDAETAPERGYYHHPSRHSNGKPIVAGWNYSWIAQLNWERNSWTAPVDTARIPPRDDTGQATARQVSALVGRLRLEAGAPAPMFVFDAGYDPISLTVDCAATPAQLLVRIRDDRVFYAAPPDRCPGGAGRPRRHGDQFRCADPATWPVPTSTLVTTDSQYGRIEVTAWTGLHPRLSHRRRWSKPGNTPIVSGTVIRVDVEHLPRKTARAQKMLWLWWAGPAGTLPDLDVCWRAYLHRFDIEHTLRFAKTTLGWVTPRVRTPEQADRWTSLVVAGYNQLRLARGLVADQRIALGAASQPRPAHPHPRAQGFLSTASGSGHPRQSAETQQGWPRKAKGQPARSGSSIPRHQEGRLTHFQRLNRKLRWLGRPGRGADRAATDRQ
ncbi:MAG: NF041680 family putative transposase [Candidatus Dormibacteria bacterium]